jgi:drug/metabolite transporter (DMT)-like permease
VNGEAATGGRDAVIVACAISAGVHAALTPAHLDEGTAAGAGFAIAAAALVGLAWALTRRPSATVLGGAVAVLGGLLASYAAAVTTGLPLLHPGPEPVEALALATKAVELVGLLAAARLLRPHDRTACAVPSRPKGTLA